ncbi:hypothetical protein, partial [Bradyrhizobium sp.]|uniref:hypothetical protein n=1 Tax=Bradyrhizobium sp. TaxID=376 RepID=UPI00290E114F
MGTDASIARKRSKAVSQAWTPWSRPSLDGRTDNFLDPNEDGHDQDDRSEDHRQDEQTRAYELKGRQHVKSLVRWMAETSLAQDGIGKNLTGGSGNAANSPTDPHGRGIWSGGGHGDFVLLSVKQPKSTEVFRPLSFPATVPPLARALAERN